MGIPGLVTNKLPTPGQPGTPSPTTNCSGSTYYTYEVAALDFVGGSTAVGTMSPTINSGCALTSLSPTEYVSVATPPVAGAASCNVFRSTANPPTSTSFSGVGNVPCGATFYDTTGTPTNPPLLPLADTSGGIQSVGMVAAQSFSAGGTGAGTEILINGAALGACPNSMGPFISCIPTNNGFRTGAPLITRFPVGTTRDNIRSRAQTLLPFGLGRAEHPLLMVGLIVPSGGASFPVDISPMKASGATTPPTPIAKPPSHPQTA